MCNIALLLIITFRHNNDDNSIIMSTMTLFWVNKGQIENFTHSHVKSQVPLWIPLYIYLCVYKHSCKNHSFIIFNLPVVPIQAVRRTDRHLTLTGLTLDFWIKLGTSCWFILHYLLEKNMRTNLIAYSSSNTYRILI